MYCKIRYQFEPSGMFFLITQEMSDFFLPIMRDMDNVKRIH